VNWNTLSGALAGIVVVVATSGVAKAEAAPFGARHQVVISAEHLAGVTGTTGDGAAERRQIDMWLFGAGNRSNPGYGQNTPYSSPRAAFDFFVTDRLSIGTSLLLSKLGLPSSRQVVFGPRIGATLPLSPHWNLSGGRVDDHQPGAAAARGSELRSNPRHHANRAGPPGGAGRVFLARRAAFMRIDSLTRKTYKREQPEAS
jgi:hypothetical protein